MRDYTEIPQMSELILEESYVLHVEATPGQLVFSLEFVLTDKHPEYHPPKPGEYLCYRRGVMAFGAVTKLVWDSQGARPARNADGSFDWDQVDFMHFADNHFELGGEVGQFKVDAERVEVTLLPDEAPYA